MFKIPNVLHPVPKPISTHEFLDALRATAPPRFKNVRYAEPRRIAMAVSGGVDSMALAYLTWQARRQHGPFRVRDNPVGRHPRAIVVDHGLRPGSGAEAAAVARELRRFSNGDITVAAVPINWRRELGVASGATEGSGSASDGMSGAAFDPASLPNVESLARRARYRLLGRICTFWGVESLLLAHHSDDQYETVLMRLLAGHGARGLVGIRPAVEIPECHDLHRVSRSGFLDGQFGKRPYLRFNLGGKDIKRLKRSLREDFFHHGGAGEDDEAEAVRHGALSSSMYLDAAAAADERHRDDGMVWVEPPPPTPVEDGGVHVFRPLLQFPKSRLVATCEANAVRWFEDPTNADPTLTLRNAVRRAHRDHVLPEALRKPAIISLAERCAARTRAEDAAADLLARRVDVDDFEPNAGTMLVRLPRVAVRTRTAGRRSVFTAARSRLRLARLRTTTALLVRKLMAVVSPEQHRPVVANLQTVTSRLFPDLAQAAAADSDDLPSPEVVASPPKTFIHASVMFIPVSGSSEGLPLKWLLCRAPYPSNQPLPRFSAGRRDDREAGAYRRTDADSPAVPEHDGGSSSSSSSIGDLYGDGDGDGDGYGYGYGSGHGSGHGFTTRRPTPRSSTTATPWRLFDGRFWIRLTYPRRRRVLLRIAPFLPEHAKPFRAALGRSRRARLAEVLKRYAPGKVRYTLPALYVADPPAATTVAASLGPEESGPAAASVVATTGEDDRDSVERWRLVALPTMGVSIPGLEDWLRCEVRYKKVDTGLVDPGRAEDRDVSCWRRDHPDLEAWPRRFPRTGRRAHHIRR